MGDPSSKPLAVLGVGGIGCAVGYALRSAGVDVTFVEADERKIEWGRTRGIRLDRRPYLPIRIEPFAQWRPAPDGLTLLCTKSYDNPAILRRLPSSNCVVPIQNGFDPQLRARCEAEGIASFVCECIPHRTHARMTRPGALHIGPAGADRNPVPSAVNRLVRILTRHGNFRVQAVSDVLPYKYSKLMYNAAISPLAAVSGLDNGQLLTVRKARKLFFTLLRENYEIFKGVRVALGQVGPFHPDTVNRFLRWPLIARTLAWPGISPSRSVISGARVLEQTAPSF